MFPLLVTIFIFTVIVNFFWTNRRLLAAASRIPGPATFAPLIGGLFQFCGKSDSEIASTLLQISGRYSSPVRFWFGPLLMVMVDRPDDLKTVLNSDRCLDKVDPYRFFRVDRGLFAAPAKLWKVHRKMLLPSFGPKVIEGFLPVFTQKCRLLSKELENFLTVGTVDVHYLVEKYTLNAICATIFEYDLNLKDETWTKSYISSIDRLTALINQRIFNPLKHPDIIYHLTSGYREETSQFDIFKKLPNQICNELRTRHLMQSPNWPSPNFTDRVFQLMDPPSSPSLQDHIATIIFAGSETSATTIALTLLMLAIHQDVQDRVYREICSIYVDPYDHNYLDQSSLARLTYMKCVIKETMRLFPVAPLVGRKVAAEIHLENVTIPAGANIIIPIYKLHRNQTHWGPNAESFDPDNFLPEKVAQRHPYCYVPFMAGIRNCIGIRYSWQLMKVMLVHLLSKYRFTSDLQMDELELRMSMVLKIDNGRVLGVERRVDRLTNE